MAFVWSQLELILAYSTMVIHHQLNNIVCGGEYDKKHGKRELDGVRESRQILFRFCQNYKELQISEIRHWKFQTLRRCHQRQSKICVF